LVPRQKALLVAILGGWLLLPQRVSFAIPGFLDYDRAMAIGLAGAAVALVLGLGPLLRFRPRWIDLPMIIWCVSPFLSSLSNSLGIWEGLSGFAQQVVQYGVPYVIGRVFFSSPRSLRELARGVLVSAILYIPLILIELRMSPQLHRWIYGEHQIKFHMVERLGGYRPMVFLVHGIELGTFIAIGSLLAIAFWRFDLAQRLFTLPPLVFAAVLPAVLILCNALNGYFAFVIGIGISWPRRIKLARASLLITVLIPISYVGMSTIVD